jgi:hypothetical protein
LVKTAVLAVIINIMAVLVGNAEENKNSVVTGDATLMD